MIQKRILVPDRVRRLPRTDWAWVDRRFLRDFAPKLSGDAVFLYYLPKQRRTTISVSVHWQIDLVLAWSGFVG